MTVGINKEDGDRILEEFLVQASKANGTKRCAEESFKIMNSFVDSQLVISILITNSMRQQGLIPKHVIDFEVNVISALTTIFSDAEKEYVPIQLQGLFQGNVEEMIEKVKSSKKFNFAVQQFVNAYYQYDLFESKYPEINKAL
jgi:hypothetical protein